LADNCNTDLVDELSDAAAGVRRSESDGQSAEAHPLKDQLDLAKVRAANAGGGSRRGFRLIRVIAPGAVE
jgi:hypothetical protein